MDVAHRRPGRHAVERLRLRVVELAEEVLHVERLRRHPPVDLSLPDLARPIGVDLDPVAVRVGEGSREPSLT